jgi:hypothetical protein
MADIKGIIENGTLGHRYLGLSNETKDLKIDKDNVF